MTMQPEHDDISTPDTSDAPPDRDQQVEQLKAELEQLRAQSLVERADIENQRKRMERDVRNACRFANKQLLGDLLPVFDSLEAALANAPDADPLAFLKKTFELLGMGKVANSAQEAKSFGLLRECDSISMNGDRLIADAKQQVIELDLLGYVRPVPREDILVLGDSAQAAMKLALHMMKRGGYISDHDELIGKRLAHVMSGGDMNHSAYVSEQYLLDLEREAFVSLCGEQKTLERISAMLKTGKPLRN